MSNKVFAENSWCAKDVMAEAEYLHGIMLTTEQANEILESIEKQLSEAMTEAGWMVINDYLHDYAKKSILSIINTKEE
jgi:hypothetical protein